MCNAWQENSSLVNGVHRVGHEMHQDEQVSPESVSFLNKTYLHHFCTFILPVQRGHSGEHMASNTGQSGYLPTGAALFCTIPDIFYLVELVS